MIPDAAIEAAYDALDEGTKLYVDWGNLKAALAAAAPHLKAEWDRSAWAGE